MVGAIGRLFLAADLSAETRRALVAKLADWRDRMPGRVVPPPNWHLTLRFLGDVAELDFDKLVHRMSTADLGTAFSITFGTFGAFIRILAPVRSRRQLLDATRVLVFEMLEAGIDLDGEIRARLVSRNAGVRLFELTRPEPQLEGP